MKKKLILLIVSGCFLVSGCQTIQEDKASDYEFPESYKPEDGIRLVELWKKLPDSKVTFPYLISYYGKYCYTLNTASKSKYGKMHVVATKIYFEQPIKATTSEEEQYRETIDLTWSMQPKAAKKQMCNYLYTIFDESYPNAL